MADFLNVFFGCLAAMTVVGVALFFILKDDSPRARQHIHPHDEFDRS
jgi:hypothetical protein